MYKFKLICRPAIDLRAFQTLLSQDKINEADQIRGSPAAKFAYLLEELIGKEVDMSYLMYIIYFEMSAKFFADLVSANLPIKFQVTGEGLTIKGVMTSDYDTLTNLGDSDFAKGVAQLIKG